MRSWIKTHRFALTVAAFELAAVGVLFVLKRTGAFYREKLIAAVFAALLLLNAVSAIWAHDRKNRANADYRRRKRTALLLFAVALLASGPLFCDYLPAVSGHDLEFHLIRIEGVADGIRDGQFPVRIHPETLSGYGYACSVYYPELLLYFPVALRLAGVPVLYAYKALCLLVNILTAYIAYYAFSRMFSSRRLGVCGSLFYTLSLYRLTCLYTRSAVGEASAMIFLPLAAYGMWLILSPRGNASARPSPVPLALGMAGLLYTHLLTSAIAAVFLLAACLLNIKRVFEKPRFTALLLAAGLTCLLTAAFLVPMLDASGRGDIAIFADKLQNRSVDALNPCQLFPLLPAATGICLWTDSGVPGEMPLGVGFGALLALLAYAFLCKKRPGDSLSRLSGFAFRCAVASLFLTTMLFPWDAVYDLGGLPARIAGTIQFPWRFLSVASLFCAIVEISCLREAFWQRGGAALRTATAVLLTFVLITGCAYQDRLLREADVARPTKADDLNRAWGVMNGEYLPANAARDAAAYTGEPRFDADALTVSDYARRGTRIALTVENRANAESVLTLPRLLYEGYRAETGDGQTLPAFDAGDGLLSVSVPAGYAGKLNVRFAEPPLWRISETVSLLSAAGLALYLHKRRKAPFVPENEVCFFAPFEAAGA